MRMHRFLSAFVAFLLLGTLLAACGGTTPATPPAQATSAPAAAQPTEAPAAQPTAVPAEPTAEAAQPTAKG